MTTTDLTNADVFFRNPQTFIIPNNGVTTLGVPDDDKQWSVLRWELESFVCEGQYADGLRRLLQTYLGRVDEAEQPGGGSAASTVPGNRISCACWSTCGPTRAFRTAPPPANS